MEEAGEAAMEVAKEEAPKAKAARKRQAAIVRYRPITNVEDLFRSLASWFHEVSCRFGCADSSIGFPGGCISAGGTEDESRFIDDESELFDPESPDYCGDFDGDGSPTAR